MNCVVSSGANRFHQLKITKTISGTEDPAVQRRYFVKLFFCFVTLFRQHVVFRIRPCSFVSDWWVGTIPGRIASLIYINFD
jgi:hypothetical protein